jgi:hypothetical protein
MSDSLGSAPWRQKLKSLRDAVDADRKDLLRALGEVIDNLDKTGDSEPSTSNERGRLHEELCYLLADEVMLLLASKSAAKAQFHAQDTGAAEDSNIPAHPSHTQRSECQVGPEGNCRSPSTMFFLLVSMPCLCNGPLLGIESLLLDISG